VFPRHNAPKSKSQPAVMRWNRNSTAFFRLNRHGAGEEALERAGATRFGCPLRLYIADAGRTRMSARPWMGDHMGSPLHEIFFENFPSRGARHACVQIRRPFGAKYNCRLRSGGWRRRLTTIAPLWQKTISTIGVHAPEGLRFLDGGSNRQNGLVTRWLFFSRRPLTELQPAGGVFWRR
jgi:hypothetical protein